LADCVAKVSAEKHKVSKYYYYPGFHEPGTALSLGINKKLWDGLSADDRNAISVVANAKYTISFRSIGRGRV
jgi:TRAP-type mannitol/chloroaromatic compound transport system substrate-binding protein